MAVPHGVDNLPTLAALTAAGPVSLFLDFDGTLVEIAAGPDQIAVPSFLPRSLAQLADRLDGRLALVSGRALDDIARHLGDMPIAQAGSHGADCRTAGGMPIGTEVRALEPEIVQLLVQFCDTEGVDLERKSHGAALHFRRQPELEAVAVRFARQVAEKHGLDVKTGKCVAELVAKGADKGKAVRSFMQTEPFAGTRPFFIGDDVTDEDGFRACHEMGGAGILVGDKDKTAAQYSLPNVAGVYEWLGL